MILRKNQPKSCEGKEGIMSDFRKLSYPKLIEGFENDIAFDGHGLQARFDSSKAAKELLRRGQKALRHIVIHLRQLGSLENKSGKFDNLLAWAMLLNKIEVRVDTKKTGPKNLCDLEGWLSWAEQFAN